MITQARLKKLFSYRPDGNLISLIKPHHKSRDVGDVVKGTVNKKGYILAHVDGKSYQLHRLIYLYHHGKVPAVLDHINRVPGDNRIENLRPATLSQNASNCYGKRKGKRFKGVHKSKNLIYAMIFHNKKQHYLGNFKTEEEAARAYDKKAKELKGDFAFLNFPGDACAPILK